MKLVQFSCYMLHITVFNNSALKKFTAYTVKPIATETINRSVKIKSLLISLNKARNLIGNLTNLQ